MAGKCPFGCWVVSEAGSDVIETANHVALMAVGVLGWRLGYRWETEA